MRIAIVNDMAMATEAIHRALLDSGRHEVAWTAAVQLGAATEVLNPDQIGLRLRTFGNQRIRVHA